MFMLHEETRFPIIAAPFPTCIARNANLIENLYLSQSKSSEARTPVRAKHMGVLELSFKLRGLQGAYELNTSFGNKVNIEQYANYIQN